MRLLLILLLCWQAPVLFAQERGVEDSNEGVITLQNYCNFLNEVAASDPRSLYEPEGKQILRSGELGNYFYEAGEPNEAKGGRLETKGSEKNLSASILFLSWNDAARYCQWRNNSLESSCHLQPTTCNLSAAAADLQLKSNLLSFRLVSAEATAHQASLTGAAAAGEMSEILEDAFGIAALFTAAGGEGLREAEISQTHSRIINNTENFHSVESNAVRRGGGLTNNKADCFINSSLQLCKALKEDLNQGELTRMPYLVKFLNEGLSYDQECRLLRQEMEQEVIKEHPDLQGVIQDGIAQTHQDAAAFLRLLLEETRAPELLFEETLENQETRAKKTNASFEKILQLALPEDDGTSIDMQGLVEQSLVSTRQQRWNDEEVNAREVEVESSLKLPSDSIPSTLVVSLGRFSYDHNGIKNKKFISEISQRIVLPASDGTSVFYEPVAVICHEGRSLEEGHHICFRQENDKYYLYDDATVKGPYSLDSKFTAINACLIAYKRVLPSRLAQEDAEDEFWINHYFSTSARKSRKKSPNQWNDFLFRIFQELTPLNKSLTTEDFNEQINELINEAGENLFGLKEAREWLTKKIHNTIIKKLPMIDHVKPKPLGHGYMLSPWQPTKDYPYQQLMVTFFTAENSSFYWDQREELLLQLIKKETDEQRRNKFNDALVACKQARQEAKKTKKLLERLMLYIGSTEEISTHTSQDWEDFLASPLISVDDFLYFQSQLEGIASIAEDAEIRNPYSPGYKFILPEAKEYFKEKWKGFTHAKEELIRSAYSNDPQQGPRSLFKTALDKCEQFYDDFKKEPLLGKQIGKLLIEPRRKKLYVTESQIQEQIKKAKDIVFRADGKKAICLEEYKPQLEPKEQTVFELRLKPFEEIKERLKAHKENEADFEDDDSLDAEFTQVIKENWNLVGTEALELIGHLGNLAAQTTHDLRHLWMEQILENTGRQSGNFNLMDFYFPKPIGPNDRAVSSEMGNEMGMLWVEPNYVLTSQTNGSGESFSQFISTNGLRCYRSPSNKKPFARKSKTDGKTLKTGVQIPGTGVNANFEWRNQLMKSENIWGGDLNKIDKKVQKEHGYEWGNGHLDISYSSGF